MNEENPTNPGPVRYAVVGCGYWGPNILRNLAASSDSVASWACDLDESRLGTLRRRYPGVKFTQNFSDVINASDVDIVVLATPPQTHHPLGLAALRAGKHLLVEKPLAPTLGEAVELADEAKRLGLRLFVDHTYLFTGAVRRIKRELTDCALGELLYIDSSRVNLGLFQSDVNVLWDLAPHDISIVDYLLDGELPEVVWAVGATHLGTQENLAYLTFRYRSGPTVHINVNWLAPVKVRQMFIAGTSKMIVYDDTQPSEKLHIYDRGAQLSTKDEIYGALVQYRMGDMVAPRIDSTEALALELSEISSAIRSRRASVSDADLGVRVVRILDAAQRSIASGGAPVSLEPRR